ncbi:waprin-Phi1 [Neodiprion lecontei]|uniref:Waprin-Phi1 n=1 Tax=Neodiprion lecontei TaxID=441921 RepID=A0A6J0BVT9_NEOLC|nr:waprin-Phi1 [Neodiprion lecontei]XP_046493292.1 waprin-Phi1-like [Neodiprion pinetum]
MATGKKYLVATILATAIVSITISTTTAQENYNYYSEKPGSCPPALPVQICSRGCYVDAHCQGIGKCCATTCGGTVCSRPVTMRARPAEKPGFCPSTPTGRWVCTPTCSSDADCPGARKCCRNRCGAMACQKPEESAPVPAEVPVNANPYLVYMQK